MHTYHGCASRPESEICVIFESQSSSPCHSWQKDHFLHLSAIKEFLPERDGYDSENSPYEKCCEEDPEEEHEEHEEMHEEHAEMHEQHEEMHEEEHEEFEDHRGEFLAEALITTFSISLV